MKSKLFVCSCKMFFVRLFIIYFLNFIAGCLIFGACCDRVRSRIHIAYENNKLQALKMHFINKFF